MRVAMKELVNILLESAGFYKNSKEQKRCLLAFAALASLTVVFCWSLLAIPFGIGAAVAYKKCKDKKVIVEE